MIVAVDVGGTKTLIVGYSEDKVVFETRFLTPKVQEDFLGDLLRVLIPHKQRIATVSIAVPGLVDQHRGSVVKCANLPWRDFELRTLLKRSLDCRVLLENDANLAGLSEVNYLDTIPQIALYVTVSTGIGAGIVINGRLLPALSRCEPGHMMLWRDGKRKEWESYASGRALKERTGSFASEIDSPIVWKNMAERVADGLFALIPTLMPDVVIIGGSMGTYFDKHWRVELEAILSEEMPDYIHVPPIIEAKNPEEAVVHGCRLYAKQTDR